jgi:hypothetical protein
VSLPLFLLALLAGQDQKLGVGGQHFAHHILKFAAGRDTPLHLHYPIPGDALDVSLPLGHEGECPSLMALVARAMAAGIPAPRETPSEVSGQQIGWDGEMAKQFKLALAEACSLRASWFFFHIGALNQQVTIKTQAFSDCENRALFLNCNSVKREPYFKG